MSETLHVAPTLTLSNGVEIPAIGLGTWPMTDAEAAVAVKTALRLGYRLIDTAENYRNEAGVGEAIRNSGVLRAEIFLTTKFNREWHSVDGVRIVHDASLKRLGLDYIDLLLIHWPNTDQDRYVEAFEGLTRLLEAGKLRAIGVSNFKPAHLERLRARGFTPHVNQIQLDPHRLRPDTVAADTAHGIVTESWSPIGRGGALLAEAAITETAAAHERSPGQVVLRWHTQRGYLPIPKSADPARQADNLRIFDFTLTDAELARIDALHRPDADIMDSDSFGH